MKRRFMHGEWYYSIQHRAYAFQPPGDYDEGEMIEPTKWLDREEYESLVRYVKENERDGLLRTDRTEDLKIVHRLIDVLQKKEFKEGQ
jgi:hypothetical protein